MAIRPEDIYNPYTSSNDLLDFVNQARVADPTNGNDVIDPVTGISLADYLLLQREAGATPSFTNDPSKSNLDTFIVPSTKAMVNDDQKSVIQLFPDEYNPDTVNDATDAANMVTNLQSKKKEALLNLEQEKAQQLGLYELRDQILTLKSQPYYAQSEYAQQQVRNLATQYEAKRAQVETYLNSPDIAKQFNEVDNIISQWDHRREQLVKLENQNRAVDASYGIRPGGTPKEAAQEKNAFTTEQKRLTALQLFPTEEDQRRVMKYAGITDPEELANRVIAKDATVVSASWLADKEKRIGRSLSLSDVIGYAPEDIETNAIDQVLDKKVKDGEITAEDARTWTREVINPTAELAVQTIEAETAAYQKKQIEEEIARLNKDKNKRKEKLDYQKFISTANPTKIKNLTKLTPEREAQIRAQAKTKAYRQAIDIYRNKLIADSFTDATDLANVPNIPLDIKQLNAQLRTKYPEAFVYPTNPNNREQVREFINKWRNIITTEKTGTADVMRATLDYAIKKINQENDRKLIDGTSTILPSNNIFENLSAYMYLGELQVAKRNAGVLGLFMSDQILGMQAGMTPEEIALAESLKNSGVK